MPLRKCARAHPAIQRASVMFDDSDYIGRSEKGIISSDCIAAAAIACDDYRVLTCRRHPVVRRYFDRKRQLTRCIRGRSLCPSLATRLQLASAHEQLGSDQPFCDGSAPQCHSVTHLRRQAKSAFLSSLRKNTPSASSIGVFSEQIAE
jgi:hypothetical protein